LKYKLTRYDRNPPQLYGLPEIHKPSVPLRSIASLNDPACYALTEFLHKILCSLFSKADSFVKNSEHFVKSIQEINLKNEDFLLNFEVVSLFTKVLVEKEL
jgi:hypothetical protein